MNTPLASVGIRGTICTIEASQEMTRVAVESCSTNVLVNGVPLVNGQLGIVRQAGGEPQITPLTQDIRKELGEQVAANRGRPASALPLAAETPEAWGIAPVKDVTPGVHLAHAPGAMELSGPVALTPMPMATATAMPNGLISGPSGGTLTLNASGPTTFTLDPGILSTPSIPSTVVVDPGPSGNGTTYNNVVIHVHGSNDPPSPKP